MARRARRCTCRRPRVFTEDPWRCHRCGRTRRGHVEPQPTIEEAMMRIALSPQGSLYGPKLEGEETLDL